MWHLGDYEMTTDWLLPQTLVWAQTPLPSMPMSGAVSFLIQQCYLSSHNSLNSQPNKNTLPSELLAAYKQVPELQTIKLPHSFIPFSAIYSTHPQNGCQTSWQAVHVLFCRFSTKLIKFMNRQNAFVSCIARSSPGKNYSLKIHIATACL